MTDIERIENLLFHNYGAGVTVSIDIGFKKTDSEELLTPPYYMTVEVRVDRGTKRLATIHSVSIETALEMLEDDLVSFDRSRRT